MKEVVSNYSDLGCENLHIVRNLVSYDSRVLKETGTLRDSGLFSAISIAGFHEPGYAEHGDIEGRDIWRVRLTSRSLPKGLFCQSLKFAEWRWRILSTYRKHPLSVIHCHDLEPLPIAVRLKHMTGAKLVYDAHELETERAGLKGVRQRVARATEERCMKSVDSLISVSPSICDWYAIRYPQVPVSLVRNVPERSPDDLNGKNLREMLDVPPDALLFIYLGGLARGRGIENMLQAFADRSLSHHLLVMGMGALKGQVVAAGANNPRIHYLPPVSPGDVLQYAQGADIGVSLIEDVSLSYRYCLPNKLFESVLSGLPVVVSNLPDQVAFVEKYRAGWVAGQGVGAIIQCLKSIDKQAWSEKVSGLAQRVTDLGWANEAASLLAAYHAVLHGARA